MKGSLAWRQIKRTIFLKGFHAADHKKLLKATKLGILFFLWCAALCYCYCLFHSDLQNRVSFFESRLNWVKLWLMRLHTHHYVTWCMDTHGVRVLGLLYVGWHTVGALQPVVLLNQVNHLCYYVSHLFLHQCTKHKFTLLSHCCTWQTLSVFSNCLLFA